jgi:predicted transcriptional regulator
VVEVKGLGRGRGVRIVGRHSILGSDDGVARLIGYRALTILRLLAEHGHLKLDEVASKLGIQGSVVKDRLIEDLTMKVVSLEEKLNKREELIEDLTEENVKLKIQISKLQEKLAKMRNRIRKLKGIIKRLRLKGAIERSFLRDLMKEVIEG